MISILPVAILDGLPIFVIPGGPSQPLSSSAAFSTFVILDGPSQSLSSSAAFSISVILGGR